QAVITNKETAITTGDISTQNIKLTAKATYLNFAVPAGDFTNYTITVTDINDNTYPISAQTLPLQRAMVNKVTFAIEVAPDFVPLESVSIDKTEIAIYPGETETLAAILHPENSTIKDVIWTSSNESLATVDSTGKVTGVSAGITTITVTTYYCLKTATCNVMVLGPVESVSIDKSAVVLSKGNCVTLSATVSPVYAGNKNVIWTSSNESVATVDNTGKVTGVDAGIATIRATAGDGSKTATCEVTVPISGEFSIDDEKTVLFSPGNLWYDGKGKFHFEANQYDFPIELEMSHVNHFYWAWEEYIAVFSAYYYNEESVNDVLFTNNSNFTVNGVKGEFRTLSRDEWVYLFDDRTDAEDKYGIGTVCNTSGIIILPDKFTDPMKNNGSGAFVPASSKKSIAANTYSGNDWNEMQSRGAVFLPFAGYKSESGNVRDTGNFGYYWSSSAHDSNSKYAWGLSFYGGGYSSPKSTNRNQAYSIRLVTDVN
ncbi:MAG: Ig-like domain-containing protein, partial [Bacteroidia bacterium]|nr:Ig-like domain-containing protein [Bacteroidia bacterium]